MFSCKSRTTHVGISLKIMVFVQEFYAMGFTSVISGFFPVFPHSSSLSRTMVSANAGSKTQVWEQGVYEERSLTKLPLVEDMDEEKIEATN